MSRDGFVFPNDGEKIFVLFLLIKKRKNNLVVSWSIFSFPEILVSSTTHYNETMQRDGSMNAISWMSHVGARHCFLFGSTGVS